MASDNSSQRDEQKDRVEAHDPTDGTRTSEAESNNDSLARTATTDGLTPSGSSHGYSTDPPSPTTLALREGDVQRWLEVQEDRRTGPCVLHGLSPASGRLPPPATDGAPEQLIIDEDDEEEA